jgi:hypothetical protein
MNNQKLLPLLALFLLTPLVYAQQIVPPSKDPQHEATNASSMQKPQQQAQTEPRQQLGLHQRGDPPILLPDPGSKIFEGIVVHADPLEVKSVSGDIRTFLPVKQQASAQLKAVWPRAR